MTYMITRKYFDTKHDDEAILRGLSLAEARKYCRDPETSSSTCEGREAMKRTEEKGPWFDVYDEE